MWGCITDLKISPLSLPGDFSGLEEPFWAAAASLRHAAVKRRQPGFIPLFSVGLGAILGHSGQGSGGGSTISGRSAQVTADPFDMLEEALEALTLPGQTPVLPMAAGAMGFLAVRSEKPVGAPANNCGG